MEVGVGGGRKVAVCIPVAYRNCLWQRPLLFVCSWQWPSTTAPFPECAPPAPWPSPSCATRIHPSSLRMSTTPTSTSRPRLEMPSLPSRPLMPTGWVGSSLCASFRSCGALLLQGHHSGGWNVIIIILQIFVKCESYPYIETILGACAHTHTCAYIHTHYHTHACTQAFWLYKA